MDGESDVWQRTVLLDIGFGIVGKYENSYVSMVV